MARSRTSRTPRTSGTTEPGKPTTIRIRRLDRKETTGDSSNSQG
ncbi:hypothetical protein [Streptomyces sp. JJ36]|nr:hypothetical protein [Streptomyces sp. JJ36]